MLSRALRRRLVIHDVCYSRMRSFSPSPRPAAVAPASSSMGLVLFGGLTAATFGLGVWQTKRYFWKSGLIKEREALLRRSPCELPPESARDDGSELSFRQVSLTGIFLPDRAVLVGPRPPPKGALQHQAMAPTGYLVYVPLIRPNGEHVLVERGWLSADEVKRRAADGRALCEPGDVEVKLDGVVSSGETANAFSPSHEVGAGSVPTTVRGTNFRQFFWKDFASMKLAARVSDGAWVVVAVASPVVRGETADAGRVELVTTPLSTYAEFWAMPETHVTYAVTWFTLCAAGILMTRRLLRKPTHIPS